MKQVILSFFLCLLISNAAQSQSCKNLPDKFYSYNEAISSIQSATFKTTDVLPYGKSSWIRRANYYSCDGNLGYLVYETDKGKKYLHEKVPIEVWLEFKNAIVETIILLLNKNSKTEFIRSIFFKNDEVTNLTNLLFESKNKNEWGADELFKFNIFKDDEESQLLNSISHSKIELVNEVEFSLGITPYDKAKGHTTNQIENRVFHSTEKLSDEYVPLIAGKNIQKYNIDFNFEEYLNYGNWLGAPRDVKFFKSPKIVVRQILSGNNLSIIASYKEAEIYFTQIGFSLIARENSNKNLKYILALLNSKAINFYHKYKYLDLEKNTFTKILIANCKKFPIPDIKADKQIPFINFVDYLLYLNNKNSEQIFTHTSNERLAAHIEDVLNMMVYELYFEKHMKEVGIDVLQFMKPKPIANAKNNEEKAEEIKKFYLWIQTPDNQVGQRINPDYIGIKSPNIISKINLATQ